MRIKNRSPLLLLALALLALALATPCIAQTTVRLSPHSVSTYDPLRGTCTITSAADGFEATRPETESRELGWRVLTLRPPYDGGEPEAATARSAEPDPGITLAGILVEDDNRPARPVATRKHSRPRRAARRARDASATAASSHDPQPSAGHVAGVLMCYRGNPPGDALPPDNRKQLIPVPEQRDAQRDVRHTLHASSHPEDKADPLAADRPAYAVRI